MDPKDLLSPEKRADMVVADLESNGGKLPPAAAKEFIDVVQKATPILSMATVRPMESTEVAIPTFGFDDQVLVGAPDELALLDDADRSAPATTEITLLKKEYMGETWLSYNVFEENIEKGRLNGRWMKSLAERVSVDIADAALNGDDTLDNSTKRNRLLRLQDGWLKQIQTNVVPGGGGNIDDDLLADMYEAVPDEYRSRDAANYRYMLQDRLALNWRRQVAKRMTGAGDAALLGGKIPDYAGVPLLGDPIMRLTGNPLVGQGLLGNPKKLLVGMWLDITVEMDKDIRRRCFYTVVRLAFGLGIIQEPSFVKADEVAPLA